MEEEYISVSQLTDYIRKLINSDSRLKQVYVRGEISNFKRYSSGHCYFSLKDEGSVIPGVMFYGFASKLKFEPKNGMKVLVRGYVDVYKSRGNYQLYAQRIIEDGLGELHIAFEQLKKELESKGYFEDDLKKPIPKFPKRIGVVTAATGAAIRDIVTTIKRRWPLCEIILFPSLVQGSLAANNIVRQIFVADNEFELDTLIVGRGGGNIEDLWAFNERIVAKAILACETPVISAVGHEIDWTIADYVADIRAATPTAAAEIAVPDIREISSKVDDLDSRASNVMAKQLNDNLEKFERIKNRPLFKNPHMIHERRGMDLDFIKGRLVSSSKEMIHSNQMRLSKVKSSNVFRNPQSILDEKTIKLSRNIDKLKVLNPLLTIQRGYAVARSKGKVVSYAKDLKKDEELELEFKDGKVNTRVL
ncbi:MAG: exodeoxyribonuclease VII large subunit [Methanobrevibacter ruminantium]|uniref:exodeoxyribonuclease VII large subunit n=1 Tax=Methanobrevibacter ruminantium TaxID=83816 RepID=UPI0026F212FA|nr:exodeoxyribonuclease VII large subunit [Methanobrevibacter ruminantium]MCI5737819.1 exodeoxyribonuclease VII large subunit [Methanobrevibacter ruminantium]MDD6048134.1 exodeoxyribonuclease VII large subunit [Methanobrevibacter ruminantium]